MHKTPLFLSIGLLTLSTAVYAPGQTVTVNISNNETPPPPYAPALPEYTQDDIYKLVLRKTDSDSQKLSKKVVKEVRRDVLQCLESKPYDKDYVLLISGIKANDTQTKMSWSKPQQKILLNAFFEKYKTELTHDLSKLDNKEIRELPSQKIQRIVLTNRKHQQQQALAETYLHLEAVTPWWHKAFCLS